MSQTDLVISTPESLVDLRTTSTASLTTAVVGLGYVGLPTALSLRQAGHRVIGYDVAPGRLQAIRDVAVDLLAGDAETLRRELRHGPALFELTGDPARLAEADHLIICVPTPVREDLTPDLGALRSACACVVEHARPGQTVVLTSTSYVGCTRDMVERPLRERGLEPGRDVFVAFSPERIDPGVPDHRPLRTPRILGGLTPACAERARRVLDGTSSRLHVVSSPEVAEFAKLLENTFRAVNIAFINEMADAAHELHLPVKEIIDAAATKPYGFMRFMPGAGVGGHCIPCDPHYLLWQLRSRRFVTPVVEAAMQDIAVRPRQMVGRIREELAGHGMALAGARIHVVGVAYKPGVADVRESPALEIMAHCLREGAVVSYTDALIPHLTVGGRELTSVDPAAVDADLVVTHTLHPGHEDVLGALPSAVTVLDTTFAAVGHCNLVAV